MAAIRSRQLAAIAADLLSGAQRQLVCIPLLLAQETPRLLLDEPTTYLDIAHQLEVLDLCRSLHESGDFTLVTVLHDLNLAFRYATHLIVMKEGRIAATGAPAEIVTAELIDEIYGISCMCIPDPHTGLPLVVPLDARQT